MLLGHYIIISIFLGRRPNVQDFNVSKQPCIMAAIEEQSDASVNQVKKRKASVITDFLCKRSALVSIVHEAQ